MAVVDLGHKAKSMPRVLRRMLTALAHFIIAWRQYHRDRRLLASLNDRELRDLGIDRCMVKNDDGVDFSRWR